VIRLLPELGAGDRNQEYGKNDKRDKNPNTSLDLGYTVTRLSGHILDHSIKSWE
jgi:hypothetical protein